MGTSRSRPAHPLYKSLSCTARLNYHMRLVSSVTTIKIAPSILAADFTRLGDAVLRVLAGGADYIHVDVMDGQFVPNISVGVPVVESLRKAFTDAFLDVHLMIAAPIRYVEAFCKAGASHLTFHVEADAPENISKALEMTRALGVRTGLSIKPNTPVSALEPWLDQVDMILVMTVEPGFGGQAFMADQMEKVAALRVLLPDCDIEVDGGIDPKTAPIVRAAGANVLVAGAAVFKSNDPAGMIAKLRG